MASGERWQLLAESPGWRAAAAAAHGACSRRPSRSPQGPACLRLGQLLLWTALGKPEKAPLPAWGKSEQASERWAPLPAEPARPSFVPGGPLTDSAYFPVGGTGHGAC